MKQFKKYFNWKQIWKGKEHSFINDIFEGTMLTEIFCQNCKQSSTSFQKFGDLTLDMYRVVSTSNLYSKKESKVSVQDLILHNFKQEHINDFKCEKCKREGIIKSHHVIQYPKILIVMIKRFVFFPQLQKITQKIDFSDVDLDLRDHYYDVSLINTNSVRSFFQDLKEEGQYQLKGYVNHHGDIDFGHYTAICEAQEQDGWYFFNDKKVRLIDQHNVINQSQKHVYLLFYERI